MVAIVVEDGTGKIDANSYASIASARSFASDRGVTLPATDDEVATLLIVACDWIQSKEAQFVGIRSYPDHPQALAWPRKTETGSCDCGVTLTEDEIPTAIVQAQLHLVIAQSQGINILPNVVPGSLVKREKVGPLEVEYVDGMAAINGPSLTMVDSLIAPFIVPAKPANACSGLQFVRA